MAITRLVNFFAPRSAFDFVFKFTLIEALVVCFALSVMMLTHGGFPFGLQRQVIDTTIMGSPFVLLALFVVSHQYKLQQELASVAATDYLTGLNNRRGFLEKADCWLKVNAGGTFMLADVDDFKSVNDTFGHEVGDDCLKAIADRLRDVTGKNDLIARIGGEEFALFVAQDECERWVDVRDALTKGIDLDVSVARRVTLSVGAVDVLPDQELAQLMKEADRRLYSAKAGRHARGSSRYKTA